LDGGRWAWREIDGPEEHRITGKASGATGSEVRTPLRGSFGRMARSGIASSIRDFIIRKGPVYDRQLSPRPVVFLRIPYSRKAVNSFIELAIAMNI
jgi:hypothetical protein